MDANLIGAKASGLVAPQLTKEEGPATAQIDACTAAAMLFVPRALIVMVWIGSR